MSCFAALTKRFGALTSAITSTTRKGLTLVLSYVCFPSDKSLTVGHFVGALIFLGGLLMKSLQKHPPHSHESAAPVENGTIGREEDWNSIPFGVKERRDHEIIGGPHSPKKRPAIVVAGSVHCEGEAGSGIGGLGIEIETDDEGDELYENDIQLNGKNRTIADIEQQ